MAKELIISIFIVIVIVTGDCVTQNYTNESINETSASLMELRKNLVKDDVNSEQLAKSINDEWSNRHKMLAYYIEHNELEKVETNLSALIGYIEVHQNEEAIVELDRTVYILGHIKNKNVFNLENIF